MRGESLDNRLAREKVAKAKREEEEEDEEEKKEEKKEKEERQAENKQNLTQGVRKNRIWKIFVL